MENDLNTWRLPLIQFVLKKKQYLNLFLKLILKNNLRKWILKTWFYYFILLSLQLQVRVQYAGCCLLLDASILEDLVPCGTLEDYYLYTELDYWVFVPPHINCGYVCVRFCVCVC